MKKYSLYILSCLMFLSCNHDILDITPQDKVSAGDVWNDPSLVELYMNGRYNELPHGFIKWAGGLRLTGITDESYYHGEIGLLNKYINGGVSASNMHLFGSFWPDAYKAIRNNSILIENINLEIGDPVIMNRFVAESRFLRCWFYTELISRYGDVPLITETLGLEDDLNIPRSDLQDVVDFVIEDLNLAIPDLPDNYTGEDFGRASKPAAIALKARALMYAASPLFNSGDPSVRWQQCADACEELFAIRNTLSSDFEGLFLNASDPEVLFFKQFKKDGVLDFNISLHIDEDRFPNGFGGHGWAAEFPLQTFVDQFETLSGEIPVTGYTGYDNDLQPVLNPDAVDYDPLNPYANRDPRLTFSINYDGTSFAGRELEYFEGGIDSSDPPSGFNGRSYSRTGYGIRKSLDESWSSESGASSDQPWIYMRLAEFYLTYAEANYFLGNEEIAREYVNRIRGREGVNMPPIDESGEALLDKIKHERRVELAFESNRWYDLRRWLDAVEYISQDAIGVVITKDEVTGNKSYKYQVVHKREFPAHQVLWPVPFSEILKSGISQNPGY